MRSGAKFYSKIVLVVFVLLLIAGYSYWSFRHYLEGPRILNVTPETGSSFDDEFIEISGLAKNTTLISLNDKQIIMEESGKWSSKLLLYPGYNIIKIYAKDRFGRETFKYLQYTLKKENISPPTEATSTLINQ